MLIEVFRTGNAAASAAGITAADLADIASFDCAANPIPNVIGHPETNSPAHGAVRGFKAEGDVLFADVPDDVPAFKPIVDGIKGGSILNRSMGFFGKRHKSNPTPGKFAPRHLGFLGAASPGIAGMPPLASYFAADPDAALTFAADDTLQVSGEAAPAVIYDAPPVPATPIFTVTDTPTPAPGAAQEPAVATDAEKLKADQDKLAADRKAHEDAVAAFAAEQAESRKGANLARVEGLVTSGHVLPADKDDLVAAFNAVDDGELIAFASDDKKAKASPVAIIAGIMAKAGKASPAGDGMHTPTGDAPAFSASGDAVADLDKVRAERRANFGK